MGFFKSRPIRSAFIAHSHNLGMFRLFVLPDVLPATLVSGENRNTSPTKQKCPMRASRCHAIPQAMQQHGGVSKTAQRHREQAGEECCPAAAHNTDQNDAQTKHDGVCTRATA